MGYAELRHGRGGDYYRGRYKIATGRYGTVCDDHGRTIRYARKRNAKQAADLAEAEQRNTTAPSAPTQLGAFINDRWWPAQDLAPATMDYYRGALELHILPFFGTDREFASITAFDITAFETALRRDGYAEHTIAGIRATLHTVCSDAVDAGLIPANPAARRRRRGRVAGRIPGRQPRKIWATPLQTLLIAERAAALTGRDDEFIQVITIAWSALRWGESLGLTPADHRNRRLRIERQIHELNGRFLREAPKDDSYRSDEITMALDVPPFLGELLTAQEARARRCRCTPGSASPARPLCEGDTYLFTTPGGAHPRRSNFDRRVWHPAVEGWYPGRGGKDPWPARPVLADATVPFPGRLIQAWPAAEPGQPYTPPSGRGIVRVPEDVPVASWVPVRPGLDVHGLRHSHKTWMAEDEIDPKLQYARMGHSLRGGGDVGMMYTHITDAMRAKAVEALQRRWEDALAARARISAHSAVSILDNLLAEHRRRCTLRAVRTA